MTLLALAVAGQGLVYAQTVVQPARGVTVELLQAGSVRASTTTDAKGTYSFAGAPQNTVIGGASLTGGVGIMSATVVGVFIPVILANGLLIGGVERFWQDVVVGVILVAAVWFDQWRRAQEARDR